MTPKERVFAFYRHEPSDEMGSNAEGMILMINPNAIVERPQNCRSGMDWFGVPWIWDEQAASFTPDPRADHVLTDISQWREQVVFPDLDAIDWEKDAWDAPSPEARKDKAFVLMLQSGTFERLWMLMGHEDALCSMITDEEDVMDFFEAHTQWRLKLLDKIKEYYNPDAIFYHDDWGTQKGLMFSPEHWRTFIRPHVTRIRERCRELGIVFEFHSCGRIDALTDELIELAPDVIQCQEINDVPAMKKKAGGKISFHSSPDYQSYFAQDKAGLLTEESLRQQVRDQFFQVAEGGCYIPQIMPRPGRVWEIVVDELNQLGRSEYARLSGYQL